MVENGMKLPAEIPDWYFASGLVYKLAGRGTGLLAAQSVNYAYLWMAWASVYTGRTFGTKN